MRITVYTDEQIAKLEEMSKIDCERPVRYVVTGGKQKQSSKGAPMFELDFELFQDNVKKGKCRDWLILNSDTTFLIKKLKDFYYSCDMSAEYLSGDVRLGNLLTNKAEGKCKIKLRQYTDEKGQEKEGYQIASYIVPEPEPQIDPEFNDDIPFYPEPSSVSQ